MGKYIILIFLLCGNTKFIAAQQKQFAFKDSLMLDSEKSESPDVASKNYILADTLLDIGFIKILPDTIRSWKNKKAFGYTKNLDSLLKDLQNKAANDNSAKNALKTISFLDRLFNASFLQLFLWLLAVLFVGFILYNFFLSKGAFKKTNKKGGTSEQISEEELFLKQDYEALLHQAYKLQDYRLATRYLFLKTLQRLSQQSLIEFAADKTNSKYVDEIAVDKRNEFAFIVRNYEYVWYGNIHISKELFDKIEPTFSIFFKTI